MRLRVIAVGTRMSAWVEAACHDYMRRLRGADAIELVEIPVARRHGAGDVKRAVEREAERILALLEPREFVVTLDERGRSFTTLQLTRWLAERRAQGVPLSFIIGGPDGLDPARCSPAHSSTGPCRHSPFRTRWCAYCSRNSSIVPRRCWPDTRTIAASHDPLR